MHTPKHKTMLVIIALFFIGGSLFILINQINNRIQSEQSATNQAKMADSALALSYVSLTNIPGLTQDGTNANMLETLQFIFRWGIAVAVLLAIFMTIIGGIQYMTTDAMFAKEEGKHKIQSAVMGLLLALSAWIILYTINPRILEKPSSELLK